MLVVVGRIVRAHGIRGDVVVDVRTDEPARRFTTGASVRAGSRTLTVRTARPHADRFLVAFDEVKDRTDAEALRGTILESEVDPEQAADGDDEYYDRQLVGMTVLDHAGRVRGTITSVMHLPAQDTLVIDAAGREVLVPFVSDLVPGVDMEAGILTLADVPGLIDELD